MTTTTKIRSQDRHVGFRIGPPYRERLEKAAEVTGVSIGQYARFVLVTHFEQTATHLLREELEKLRKEVTELRAEFGLATYREPNLALVKGD